MENVAAAVCCPVRGPIACDSGEDLQGGGPLEGGQVPVERPVL